MNITVRELSGVHSKERYAEVVIDNYGDKIDLGVLTIKERKELAEHLRSVIDDLLYELPGTMQGAAEA